MRKQRAPPRRADARNVLQRGVHARLLAQLAVVRNAEAVRLIADALDQVQRGRLAVQQDALLPVRQEDLLQPLRQAEDRDVVAHGQHRLARKAQLLRAAVDEDEVRQVGKARQRRRALRQRAVRIQPSLCDQRLPLLPRARQASGEHLVHGGEVVRALDRFDAEVPVFPVRGLAVDRHDHARHGQHTLRVRDVVALDAPRRVVHAHRRRQRLAGADGPLPLSREVRVALLQRVRRVLDRQLDQLVLGAPLRLTQHDAPALPPPGQHALDVLRLLRQLHAQQLAGGHAPVVVELQNEL